jgi:hypothetical protein
MAIRARHVRILVDGVDLSGQNNSVEVAVNTDRSDVTTFQQTAKSWITQDPEGTITHAGYFAASGGMEAQLQALVAADGLATVGVAIGTNAAGHPVYVLPNAPVSGMNVAAPVGNVITVNANWGSGEAMQRAIELYTGTLAATGAQTGRDLAATGSAGGTAYLWVTGITGTATNATITVQSDSASGFTGPTTKATFTFSALGAYAVAMTGTVGRYVRANLTGLGGATNITFVCAAVVGGVTQS